MTNVYGEKSDIELAEDALKPLTEKYGERILWVDWQETRELVAQAIAAARNGIITRRQGQDKKIESSMTVKLDGDVHDVKCYNDDTGYGETSCGKMVGPWDVTICGIFDCKTCVEAQP
jgi:hypothetical protein